MSFTIEGTVDEIHVEDGGRAKWTEIAGDDGPFVRIHSYDDHTDFDRLLTAGRRYQVHVLPEPSNQYEVALLEAFYALDKAEQIAPFDPGDGVGKAQADRVHSLRSAVSEQIAARRVRQ